jgi:dienelactone hydrolase
MAALAEQARQDGATKVIVGGASLGAMAALRAAEVTSTIDGVIWIGGGLRGSGYDFNEADVSQVAAPMLLMGSSEDPTTNPDSIYLLAEWATAPAQVLMLDSDRHGTDVLEAGGAAADELINAIVQFVADVDAGTLTNAAP